MARPRLEQPTPAEFEILKVLWSREGASTVRDVFDVVNFDADPPRAYTTVMSLLTVMAEKGLVRRVLRGRAFIYEPAEPRERTLGSLLGETLGRAFDGSASLLVAHLLEESGPSAEELDRIRSLLDGYQGRLAGRDQKGGPSCSGPQPED
jgi:predicted transcriptional regulator